ncbi:hypothetical protein DMENIID0001_031200 [Sergentomyia squamirostris]
MIVALILLGIAIVAATIYVQVKKRKILKLIGPLEHFPQWPIIGGVQNFMGKDVAGITATIDHLLTSVKLPAYTWVGPLKLIMVLDDPEDVEILLSDPAALYKPYVYKFFKNDRGLITSEPHIWKTHRKILSPSFSINVMKHLLPMFNTKINRMINNMKQLDDGVDVNLLDHLYMCTLDMISASATDVDIDLHDGKNCEYVQAVIAGADLVATRIINVPYHIEWIYRLSKLYEVEKRSLKAVNEFLDRVIKLKRTMFDEVADAEEERREELAKLNNEEIETKPKIIINQLFRYWTRGKIEFQDVRDELDVMIYTGSDTSTHLTSYTLLMLAIHPEIQQKVVEELQSVFVDETVPFDYDSVKQLTYLEMVIKETLRLYPVIPYIAREVKNDVKLRSFTVPSGTIIAVPIRHMNRNPVAFGPNPDLFNPDNFLPERVAKRHPYQYMPFSCGPRNCIGMTYALYSVKAIVAMMMMNFRISTRLKFKDIKVVYNITLRITNENLVNLKPREDFFKNQ